MGDSKRHVGRVPLKGQCEADASRWTTPVTWTSADGHYPVYGHPVLIANHWGRVSVLDLRLPDGESWEQVSDEERHKRVEDAFKRHDAKWWCYTPFSPPLNVHPTPWRLDADGNPVATEATDPPREEWEWPKGCLGVEIVK